MSKVKFKVSFFVMRMWQTGNVGSYNIKQLDEQPENGFKSEGKALAWLLDSVDVDKYSSFSTYTIMKIYEPKQ